MYTVLHRIVQFMFSVLFIAAIALNAQEPQVPITLFLDANEAQLTPEQSNSLSRIRSQATTKAAHLVRVKSWEDIEQLVNTDAIQINLFPGVQFVADKTRIESWYVNEYSWVGKPRNGREMGEYVILSFIKKNLAGIIWVNSTLYGVSSLGSNILVVRELDQSKSLPEHPPGFESGAMIDSSAPLGSPEGTGSSPNSLGKVAAVHPTYDLMVVYTDQALSAAIADDSSIDNLIILAVAQANTVYNNSEDGGYPNLPDVSLVYKGPVGSYTEDPDMDVNLNRLYLPSDDYMDNVHDLREQYGVDVVVLLTNTGQYKGLAKEIKAYSSTAFAVVQWDELWYYTLTHEIGHLFGSRHDTPLESEPYPYGHAFFYTVGDDYQTVVASKGSGTMYRIPYLSNPSLDPYGVSIGDQDDRDNARVHHERSAAVAGFKPPSLAAIITFKNSFVGVGTWGVIKVNDVQYSAPKTVEVADEDSVDAEAVNQNINGIAYTFTEWKVGTTTVSTSKAETFTPTGHTTYTAHFSGKPNQVTNLRIDTDEIGELIHLLWTENPNTNVKYRIYSKPKYGSESLRATLDHGTSEWTDPLYELYPRPQGTLRSWDARSYYTVEETEATAQWTTRYARIQYKRMGDDVPQTFSLSNYPNPFNPSTILTFGLPVASRVRLAVYDLQGREVCTYTAVEEAGYRQVVWDGKDQGGRQVSAGVYVYHLVAIPVEGGEPYIDSGKMVLLK